MISDDLDLAPDSHPYSSLYRSGVLANSPVSVQEH